MSSMLFCFKNIIVEFYGGCGMNCIECNNCMIVFCIWGYINQVEIFDFVFDGNLLVWFSGYVDLGLIGVQLLYCLQDVIVCNNFFRNLKVVLMVDFGEWGCDFLQCFMDDVIFDCNLVVVLMQMNQFFGGFGVIVVVSDLNVKMFVDLDIMNNFISGFDGGLVFCFQYQGGNDIGFNVGIICYVYNICYGDFFLM